MGNMALSHKVRSCTDFDFHIKPTVADDTVVIGWAHLSLQCSRIHLQSAFDLRSRRCEFKAGQAETNASLYYSLKMSVC